MKVFLNYLGIIMLLLGVICMVVYKLALPENGLLIAGIVLEVVGILAYIIINKKLN
jgi:hypothetical protein